MIKSDLSVKSIIATIPQECFEKSNVKSAFYLIRDFLFFAALYSLIIWTNDPIFALPLSLILGTVLTGIFIIGHDCGHRSFSPSIAVNDWVGELTTAMALWPFHIWRLSHDIHHRHTNNIEKDIAWVPYSVSKYKRLPMLAKFIYLHSRSTLFYFASSLFTFYYVMDGLRGKSSVHFKKTDLTKIRRSILITAIVLSFYAGSSYAFAGWFGVIMLFIIPQLVFHFWLSTFTLFHHTTTKTRFMADSEWTFAKAQLESTVHVSYPQAIEWMTHDINWHVPHHVCVGIPHYHLRHAHRALTEHFGDMIHHEVFSLDLINSVIKQCHLIRGKQLGQLEWVPAEAAEPTPVTT